MSPFYAVWDEAESQFTIGRGLIFLEEVNVIARENNIDDITFVWCSDREIPSLFDLPQWGGRVLRFSDREHARNQLKWELNLTWGMSKTPLPGAYDESLLYLQSRCGKVLPELLPKEIWCQQANAFMAKQGSDKRQVVLHLKQSVTNTLSNAQFSEWKKFIIGHQSSCFFIIVGNECPHKLLDLPNVCWTGGKNLCLDLAIIHLGDVFMGMASGFCQMAMFNTKPYVIFKHPRHHAEKMEMEFGKAESFSFNNSQQRFLMEYDQYEILLKSFNSICAAASSPHV